MPRYKPFDYKQTVMLPLSLENQLLPGTFEFALHYLIESGVDCDLDSMCRANLQKRGNLILKKRLCLSNSLFLHGWIS
jgi:hypothetical protein